MPPNPKDPPAYLPGSVFGTTPTVIGASDSPANGAVTVYDNNSKVADSIEWKWDFVLAWPPPRPKRATTGTYSVKPTPSGRGTPAAPSRRPGKDAKGNILTSWTPGAAAGVTAPGKWNVNIPRPVPLLTAGDLFNEALKKQTYTTK